MTHPEGHKEPRTTSKELQVPRVSSNQKEHKGYSHNCQKCLVDLQDLDETKS